MTGVFLPKVFDKYACGGFAVDTQYGKSETQPHWHRAFEIIRMHAGQAEIFFFDKWRPLRAGECAILPPGYLHCVRCTDEGAIKTVIGFTEECISMGDGIAFAETVESLMPGAQACAGICKAVDMLCEANGLSGMEREPLCRGYIFQLYARMLSLWASQGAVRRVKKSGERLGLRVREYILEHLCEKLSPYTVAQSLGVSYSHMARVVREEFHESFGELVCRLRIDRAKKILVTTDMRVTEVCYAVGFSDASYFTKTFRAHTGTTPKKYRSLD